MSEATPGDVRRGHARALVPHVVVAASGDGTVDARVERGPHAFRRIRGIVAPPARRGDLHGRSVVAVVGLEALALRGAHGNDAAATRRRVGVGTVVGVARRDHHHRAVGDRRIDGGLLRARARPRAAEAQVDHARRSGIVRHTGDRTARCPDDGVVDVALPAPATAEHPHRQDLGHPVDARNAHAIIGVGSDRASHVGAVPRRREGRRTRIAEAGRLPVAWVRRVGVARVAVVGGGDVVDHVVAREKAAGEIRMLLQRARIEHGHHDRRRAGGDVPRPRKVGTARLDRRLLVVPLAVGGGVDVEGIVRRKLRVAPQVGIGISDIGILFHEGRDLRRARGIDRRHEAQEELAARRATLEGHSGSRQRLHAVETHAAGRLVGARGIHERAVAILDDETAHGPSRGFRQHPCLRRIRGVEHRRALPQLGERRARGLNVERIAEDEAHPAIAGGPRLSGPWKHGPHFAGERIGQRQGGVGHEAVPELDHHRLVDRLGDGRAARARSHHRHQGKRHDESSRWAHDCNLSERNDGQDRHRA